MLGVPPHLLEHVASRFRVLGDESRLRIIEVLREAGELNVGELVERLEMSQANVSKHLRVLLEAGIVTRRRQGTAAFYSVSDPSIVHLCEVVCDRLRAQKLDEAEVFAAR